MMPDAKDKKEDKKSAAVGEKITVGGVFVSQSEADTFEFAKGFASRLKGGECIALFGGLGAGKTVFSKGIAAGLSVMDTVTSPTFIIMNEYRGEKLKLYHFDMYRIDAAQAENLGFLELFGEKNAVCLIEWPENIREILLKNAVKIEITRAGENGRTIKFI